MALYKAIADKVVQSSIVSTTAIFGYKIEEMIHKTIDFLLDITKLLINYKHVSYYYIDVEVDADLKCKKKVNLKNEIKIDHRGMKFYVANARTCGVICF